MKSYTLPAAALLAASALLLIGIGASIKNANAAAAKLESDRQSLDNARQALAAAQTSARVAAQKSEPAKRFLETWTPHLTSETSIDEIFGRLDTLAVDNLLSPSGKNFTVGNYFFNGRQLQVQTVSITVAGDYARTLNWLGAVESAFPLARVQQISYTPNGTSLALSAELVFPKKFDAP